MNEDEANRRWKEIDAELEALKRRRSEIGEDAYQERRDKLRGELDALEYEAGVDYLERRDRGEA